MSIFVIGKFYAESFALHIAETLATMGNRVTRYEPGIRQCTSRSGFVRRWQQAKTLLLDTCRSASPTFRRYQWRGLLAQCRKSRPQLTIVCHDFLFPEEVRYVKEATGTPVVLWFPDSISVFNRSYFLNAAYDALFFKDPYIVHMLRASVTTPAFYLPECCASGHIGPSLRQRNDYACDIATAGNMYPYRAAFFVNLVGHDVKIWGNPAPAWMDVSSIRHMIQDRFVAYEEKVRVFRSARIVLNSLHPAEIWGVNARAFEVAAAGAFQLIDWRPGLEQLFRDGIELVSFTGVSDLKKKVAFYLEHPELREGIAERGRLRAIAEHTYEKRLALLIDTVEGRELGYPMPEIQTTLVLPSQGAQEEADSGRLRECSTDSWGDKQV